MKRILFVSAGSSRWGTGHLRRSLALVSFLRWKGWDLAAVAMVRDNSDRQKLQSWTALFNQTLGPGDELTDGFYQGLIIDVPEELQADLIPWLNRVQRPVVALDWYSETGDGLIKTINLRGGIENLRYAIIRPEFHQAITRRTEEVPFDLVIMAGGGDGRSLWDRLKVVLASPQLAHHQVAVIRGPLTERESGAFPSEGLKIYRDPENLADLMARARVAITNAGTSMMEFAFLGVPMIIFPQSRQEDHFCQLFLENGVGVLGQQSALDFSSQITTLWEDEKLRRKMSQSGQTLIDGKGLDRISDIVADTFLKENNARERVDESICH